MTLPWLSPHSAVDSFPDPATALTEPNGLLAAGGDLAIPRLLSAYRQGIFPWFDDHQPILWWSPDPRAVLFPEALRVSRSLRKTLRRGQLRVAFDSDFAAVIDACAAPRAAGGGTWITTEMRDAYCALHAAGHAHSVEVRDPAGKLVGGLYGVAIGRAFFGESMFSRVSDASKVALVHLVRQLGRWDFQLIDCQVTTHHLLSLGAREIPRSDFLTLTRLAVAQPGTPGPWQADPAPET